jgi:dihydroorotate dehydrogenase (fumarate)
MKCLETTFAGMNLRNPFIVSSSSLTNTPEKNLRWEEAGAGAVVLKSLFEEEIEAESESMVLGRHTEESDYLYTYYRAGRLDHYLKLIAQSKKKCSIPVIASINCFRNSEWTDFAFHIANAGADALELNIMSLCSDEDYVYGSYEHRHIEILKQIKQTVDIPVIIKLGHNFTNPLPLVKQLYANGVAAVVLFNRMVSLDIHIDKLTYTHGNIGGHVSDLYEVLRWMGIISTHIPSLNLAASGGVADGEALVKAILAGASAVEVCTALYRNGAPIIGATLEFLSEWMKKNHYTYVSQFRGLMNAGKEQANDRFERVQFFKNYSLRDD